MTGARIYGRSGQAQHGLDVYGTRRDNTSAVYQMRCRRQELTPAMLRKAVKDYFDGEQPHAATSFQLCWADSVDDVALDDELRKLRTEYAGKRIDLRDQRSFTTELMVNRLLVLRWFGEATTDAVYGAFAQAPTFEGAADTDGLLRGPLAASYLMGDLEDAMKMRGTDPGRAAALLGEIADKIEAKGYRVHAADIRAERRTALIAAGRLEEAYREIISDLEAHVDRAGSLLSFPDYRRLLDLRSAMTAGAFPPATPRLASDPVPDPPATSWPEMHPQIQRASALLSVEAARDGSVSELTALLEATSGFVEAGGMRHEGAVAAMRRVAEMALVSESPDVLAGHPGLRQFVVGLPAGRTAAEEDDDVRLRTAIADAYADHDVLESQARYGVIPQRLVSVVHARRARWHSWHAKPNDAHRAWLEAIQSANSSSSREDAGDYLWAVRSIDSLYRESGSLDGIEYGRRAQAVVPRGRALFTDSQAEISALRELSRPGRLGGGTGSHASSVGRLLRRLLHESIIRADLAGELEAHRLLAEHYQREADPLRAVWHALRAGDDSVAVAAAKSLGAETLDALAGAPIAPWSTKASLTAFRTVGDVLTREQVVKFLPWIRDCLRARPIVGWNDNEIRDRAMHALEAVALQLAPDDAALVEEMIDPYLNLDVRQSTMRSAVGVAARMLRAWPDLSMPRRVVLYAIERFPAYVAEDIHLAGPALWLLVGDLEDIANRSESDECTAVKLLMYLGVPHPKVLRGARARARAVLDTATQVARAQYEVSGPSHQPAGVFGRLLPVAEVADLARQLVNIACDGLTSEFDRTQAILALGHLAPKLSAGQRDSLFNGIWPLVNGLSPRDVDVPLVRGSLSLAVLRTAAKVAIEHAHIGEVLRVAHEWLLSDSRAGTAAWAIVDLGNGEAPGTLEMLVEHRDPDVREAAAALWLCDPSNPEIGRRLARDSETDVRHHLARGLKKLGADAQELRDELEGCLADDSSADVRQAIKDVVAAGKPQR
ncbi:hypothetical protein GCM10022255_069100 [Dactylosporangium darangshiense]|uniref:HEAT repeat domain-containing protein n=1 Tax=Dactylosporangium darangshiense TaxID=579108 RepID=A0ABP8DHT2_9ACTN